MRSGQRGGTGDNDGITEPRPLVPSTFEPSPVIVARGPGTVTINHGSTFLVAGGDGGLHPDQGHGLYSDDTRYVSRHELRLNGRPLTCLSTARLTSRRARWTLVPTTVATLDGRPVQSRVTITVDREVGDRRLREDVVLQAYGRERVELMLTVGVSCDFADVFEVRTERWQRRTAITTMWDPRRRRSETSYRRDDFVRRCILTFQPVAGVVTNANGEARVPVDLLPGHRWRMCIDYDLLSTPTARPRRVACPDGVRGDDRAERLHRRWLRTTAVVTAADPRLETAFVRALDDFGALRLYDHDFSEDVWVPAAGVPWYVAVFGRDAVIASLQALPVHPLFAIGTLQKLAQWQAVADDPVRDAEPGKICHEMRVGEWARFRTVPHSPYYGTADATPLYLLLLGETYRWLGDAELLRPFRAAAERCLAWVDAHGDRDGDGLQEYAPRRPTGYRNHCWRDAEDGVLDEEGGFPPHPIGTCDLDAYVHAAKATVADLFAAWGDDERARRLREEACALRRRYVDAYWLESSDELAFARDGAKRRLRTPTSLPGHALWLGMLDRRRGEAVAERLMRDDLFTGWGLRTLSSAHPSYDPHSYQRGSVWPHDTMIGAAGLLRYGREADGWRLVDGLLAAVAGFERSQVPELFAGLRREQVDVPVPYARANVPQAWAAGSIFHAVRLLLGLEPDIPGGALYVDPRLPPWCPWLRVENIRIGSQRVTIEARRGRDGTCSVDVESARGALRVVHGRSPHRAIPAEDA